MQTQQPNTYTKEQFLTFYRMISPSIQEPPEHLKQFSLILSNKLLQPINETNLHLFDSDYNINPDISYPVPSTRGRGRGGRGGRRGGSITTVGRGSSSSLPFSTVGRGRGTSIGGVKSPLGSKLPAWALDEEENNNTNPLSNNNSTPPTTDDDTFGSGSKFEPVSLESLSAATLKMNESWKHLKQPSKDVSSNEALENLDLTWDSQWYYLTEENNEPKGPYSLSKLKEWLDFSYFQPDTRITQDVEAEDVFIIGDVIKKLQQQEEKNDNVTSDEIETSLTPNNNLTTLVVEEKKDDVNNFLTEKEITRSGLLSSVLSDVINEDQIKPTSSLLVSSSLVGNEKTPVTLPPTLNQPTTPTLQPQQPSIGFGGAWGYNQPMNHMVDNLPHHAFMNPQLPYSNIPPQHMGHHSFLPYPQNTHWMMGFGNMHSPQMPSVTEIESQFQNMLHQQHLMMSQANSQILQQQHMQHQQHLQQQPILQQPPLQQQTNIIPTATSPTAISPSVTPKVHDVNEITSLPPIVPVILNSEEESNLNIVENDISPKEIGESLEDKFEKSANKNKQTSKKKKEEKQTNQTKQKSSEKKQTKPKVETKVEPILTVKTEPVFRSLPPSESINFSNDVKEEKGWGSSIVVTKPTVPTLKEIMEEQKKEQENKKQQAEHKKKLEVEQAKKELQQQIQQQPLLGKTGWGATPITVQSNLKEIIEEETKKKKQSEQKKTVQQNQASVVKQSIWGAGSLPSSNTKESNTKFKSVPAPQGTTTTTFVSTPTKAVDKNQLNFQGIKAAPTVNPTTVKEEEDQEEMFWDTTPTTTNTANTTPKNEQKKSSKKKKNKGGNTATTQQSTEKKDEFPALSVPSNGKSNPFGQSDDVSQDFKEWFKKSVKKFKPVDNSFMYFLLSLNSEKEVVEYITEYLGDSAPVQKFAQEFIANKSFEGFKDVKKKK